MTEALIFTFLVLDEGSDRGLVSTDCRHEVAERKTITQLIKAVAYGGESCLASLVGPFFARRDEEVRAFLKTVFIIVIGILRLVGHAGVVGS